MTVQTTIAGCADPACNVARDGKCLNGVQPAWKCPQAKVVLTVAGASTYAEPLIVGGVGGDAAHNLQHVRLSRAEELDLKGAERLAQRDGVIVVALFAPNDAGKTTLLAKLYENFHRGPAGEIMFAGSETIVAFEKLCHGSRLDSGARVPSTPRTRLSEPNYLHLALKGPGGLRNFLLVDRNGEEYMNAIGSSESCRALFEISRSDLLLMLLDGERMLEPGRRQVAVSEVTRGLRALIDNRMLDHRPLVQILLTKYDMVEASPKWKPDVDRAFVNLRQAVTERFSEALPDIVFEKVAARPVCKPDTEARNLDRVIGRWPFGPSTFVRTAPRSAPRVSADGRLRAFLQFETAQ